MPGARLVTWAWLAARRSALVALVAVVALALACGGERRESASRASPAASPESLRQAARAESLAAARDEWNAPEVVKRLTEAGLVVADRADTVRQSFLRVPGARFQVSRSELQVYIYPDTRSRAADSEQLDTTRAAPRNAATSPWPGRARLIVSGNLLAVHLTQDDLLAERVSNALTARHLGVP